MENVMAIMSLAALIPSGAAAGEFAPSLTSESSATVKRALELANDGSWLLGPTATVGLLEWRRRIAEKAEEFSTILDSLAGQVDENLATEMKEWEGRSIEAKLVTIARDRSVHPDRYDEIKRHFITGRSRGRSGRAPEPSAKYVTEEYRLAWEYFLWAPPQDGASPKWEANAIDALRKLANNASILTLRHASVKYSQEGLHPSAVMRTHLRILWALRAFPNQEGLHALLECEERAMHVFRSPSPNFPIPELENPEKIVLDMMKGKSFPKVPEKWRPVLRDFPETDLPPGQREFLQKLRSATEGK